MWAVNILKTQFLSIQIIAALKGSVWLNSSTLNFIGILKRGYGEGA